jgi:hypothetical protein
MKKIACFLIFIAGMASFSALNAQDPARVGTGATWQVQKYDLDVTLPADSSRTIGVKAVLAVKNVSSQAASTLTLRISPQAEIAAVRSNGTTINFSKTQETIGTVGALQRAVIRIPTASAGSVLNVSVDYTLKLADNSGVGSITPSASTFLPLAFWYPTPNSWFFPKGADAAPLKIRVTSPSGQKVVSSGVETAGGFEQKLNVQPFFLAGSWEVRTENGVSIYAPQGLDAEGQKRGTELAALFSEARAFMGSMLGSGPDVPLRIVTSRRGPGFMTGGTVVVEEAVFRRSRIDSQTAMTIAEAAAKLYIGNTVLVNGDGFGVVSEGLVRYLATLFLESKFGREVADVERMRQRNSYAAVSKRDAPMALASSLDDFYYPLVANKGAMAWRLIAARVGSNDFGRILRSQMQDGNLTVAELRQQFSAQKELVDYLFDQVTDMNLQIGLPQISTGETKSALRNTGSIDANVEIAATTSTGERLRASAVIPAMKYGEVSFKTPAKIVRIEVDSENLYPQTEYSDDVQPRETTESDPLLAAKREFDKQNFAAAETTARTLLKDNPHLDDLRIIMARALLAQNKNAEADREFKAVLDEKLPTSRSMAWANVGLAEIASRANQRDATIKFIDAVLAADAEYGASLAARNLRNKVGSPSSVDPDVKAFFSGFDKAAASNRKADVDALVVPGEVTRFAGGVSGSTESWQTTVKHVDRVDANTVLVEAAMAIKLLNKEQETGLAVYRLVRAGGSWKLAAVEMFEVR